MLSSFSGSYSFGRRVNDAGMVVKSGLQLHLDAATYTSGTTWSDITGNGYDATLVNEPVFSSSNGGYFTFQPASTQYATVSGIPLTPNSYTKSIWCMLNSVADNNLISSSDGGHFMYTGGSNKLYCGHSGWENFPFSFASTADISTDTWYNFTLTFNTTVGMALYINGNLDNTYTAEKTPPFAGNVNIGCYDLGTNALDGRVAQVLIYNKVLSPSEVMQNFHSSKLRYSL